MRKSEWPPLPGCMLFARQFAAQGRVAAREPRAGLAAPEPEPEPELRPDPANPKKVRCEACNASISRGRAASHPKTKVHKQALARAARAAK